MTNQLTRLLGLIASSLIAISIAYILATYDIQLSNPSISNTSKLMIVLTTLIIPICFITSYNNIVHKYLTYTMLLLSLELILIGLFSMSDIVLFYVLFELALLPLYQLIGSYGSSNDRLRASILLWSYTFIGSLCMLVSIVWLIINIGTTDINIMNIVGIQLMDTQLIWLLIGIGIANKIPSIPMHIWLPRAHVEANISTSILLAAIILKLSTYASLLLLINILPNSASYYSSIWLTLALISYIHASLATISQVDSKILIAYSSIAHMSIITIGIHSNNYIGLIGAILLAIAHALSSSSLFIIFGQVLYDRLHTRVLYYISNIVAYTPSIRTILLLAIVANSATPTTINWIAELYVLIGISYSNILILSIIATTVIATALYSYWLYSYIVGNSSNYILMDMTQLELSSMLYLLVPNIILGINPWLLEHILIESTISLVY